MVKPLPQACPVQGRVCGESATGAERIDSAHGTFSCEWLYRLTNREFARLLTVRASKSAKLVAAIAAAGLVLSPALATGSSTAVKKRPSAVAVSFDPISSFTPANGDPRLAAAFANKPLSLTDFKFTPAAAKGRPSQLRVAIRARVGTPARGGDTTGPTAAPALSALTPASYNLGVAVGWRRFAVSGDVAKVKSADPALGGRETAVVGVSYSLKRFTGRVAVGADRSDGRALAALRKG